jgi:hypothetical protein
MSNEATMAASAAPADEWAEVDWLADLGEILGPVTHEFNNFLNTLLLQVAVLDLSAPQEVKSELAVIRRQGREVAAVVKQLQQLRRRRHGEAPPGDLNQAVVQATAALARRSVTSGSAPRIRVASGEPASEPGDVVVRLRLTEDLPRASAGVSDLRRLCRFLVGGLAWAISTGGDMTLATDVSGAGLVLRVEVAGTDNQSVDATGSVAQLLEGPLSAEGPHRLELAACQSLVRRLSASLRIEARTEGRQVVVVDLPAERR